MQVTYTLTRKDFIAANRQITAKRMLVSQLVALVLVIITAAVFSKDLPIEKASVFVGIALIAGVLGLFVAGPLTVSRRYGGIYDQVPGLQSTVELNFDPEGVWVETVNGRHHFELAKLHRIQETKGYFFLFATETSAQIIPKSALSDDLKARLRR